MKIAVLMDDIRTIKTYKDTTFALMLSAQRRGHEVFILQQPDWFVRDGRVSARVQRVELTDRAQDYHRVLEETTLDLSSVAVLLQLHAGFARPGRGAGGQSAGGPAQCQ